MGQSEPCRAQLAIWSRVVRAYCIAPSFFSCDGRGTSRRMPPVTGSRLASLLAVCGSRDVADFGGEVVIEAAGAARKMAGGIVVVAGLKSVTQSVNRLNRGS
jgi:hypothetical protein